VVVVLVVVVLVVKIAGGEICDFGVYSFLALLL
jgi:hypothetical protein